MRGRKPIPVELKILKGNPGHRPLNENIPRPERRAPSCPAHLDTEAQKEWRRVAKEMADLGMLTNLDRGVLACYCQAWSRLLKAQKMVEQTGEVLKSKDTGAYYQNPYLSVVNRAMDQVKAFAAELGLSPSSRSRVHVSPDAGQARRVSDFARQRRQG